MTSGDRGSSGNCGFVSVYGSLYFPYQIELRRADHNPLQNAYLRHARTGMVQINSKQLINRILIDNRNKTGHNPWQPIPQTIATQGVAQMVSTRLQSLEIGYTLLGVSGFLLPTPNGETAVKTSTKAVDTRVKPLPGLVRVGEAADFLSISRASLYQLISRGEIPVRRIGSSIRIPREWLERQAAVEEN